MDFCEYEEEQIANGNKFNFPAQLQYCHDNYDGTQPSSSQLSRVWLKREEWKKVKPGRDIPQQDAETNLSKMMISRFRNRVQGTLDRFIGASDMGVIAPLVVRPLTGRTIGMVLGVSWGQAQPDGMLPG
jgi:hypothetical protein